MDVLNHSDGQFSLGTASKLLTNGRETKMRETRKQKQTLLLLDDEEDERSTAQEILRGEPYTILEADCYKGALAVFEKNRKRVDLLVADISLPDGNGCEFAIAMREQKPDLKVLFVSGHVGSEVCRFYGLDVTDLHFLRKPFKPEELINAVRRVLRAAMPFPRMFPRTRTA